MNRCGKCSYCVGIRLLYFASCEWLQLRYFTSYFEYRVTLQCSDLTFDQSGKKDFFNTARSLLFRASFLNLGRISSTCLARAFIFPLFVVERRNLLRNSHCRSLFFALPCRGKLGETRWMIEEGRRVKVRESVKTRGRETERKEGMECKTRCNSSGMNVNFDSR